MNSPIMETCDQRLLPGQVRRVAVSWSGRHLEVIRSITRMALSATLLIAIAAEAHPLHLEAIQRPCEIRRPDGKGVMMKGKGSFFLAGGYLIFQLDSEKGEDVAGAPVVTGVINLAESTGTLFQTDVGPVAEGAVSMAERSPQVVHMEPGVLASWGDGHVLVVSGSAIETAAPRQQGEDRNAFSSQVHDQGDENE